MRKARPPLGPGGIPGLRAGIHGLCPEIPTEVAEVAEVAELSLSQLAAVAARYAYARAVPFLLAAEHSAMLRDSEPPDAAFFDDAHLPYPAVSLWFARPVELVLTSADFDTSHLLSVALAVGNPEGAGLDGPAVWLSLTRDDRIVVTFEPSWKGHGWASDIFCRCPGGRCRVAFQGPAANSSRA